MALAVGATRLMYDSTALHSALHARLLLLVVAAAGFYFVNSFPVDIIMALTEQRSMWRMWCAMVQRKTVCLALSMASKAPAEVRFCKPLPSCFWETKSVTREAWKACDDLQ